MEDELVEVHEGGELSWMQRLADLVRALGHRIETHGDAARIVVGDLLIDVGPLEGLYCFQLHLELPVASGSAASVDEIIGRAVKIYRAVSAVGGPVRYVLDDSLGDLSVVHINRCYRSPHDLVAGLGEVLRKIAP